MPTKFDFMIAQAKLEFARTDAELQEKLRAIESGNFRTVEGKVVTTKKLTWADMQAYEATIIRRG